jgi:S1-C subfamily serine protease
MAGDAEAGTVRAMRVLRSSAVLALVAGVSACLGAVLAIWLGDDGTAESTSVVVTATTATGASPVAVPALGSTFDPAAIYARRAPGVVTLYSEFPDGETQGSGFVVGKDGAILTNAHVITNVAEIGDTDPVSGAKDVYVEFTDGERVKAAIVGWDLFNDLGVVKVDPKEHQLRVLPLGDSDAVRVGQPVAAIGSPFGKQSSLAVGVVSATGRTIDSLTSRFAIADAIQIDAPINRGNSGGALFDAAGRVIGITAQIQSTSGTAEGVGFAIPIDIAARAVREILRHGRIDYAYLGIETQDVTPGLARALGLPATRGALVTASVPGSPAEKAGIAGGKSTRRVNGLDVTVGGDVIVAIAGVPVRSSDDIGRIVGRTLSPGQHVSVTLAGPTGRRTVTVTLGKRPARTQ